MSLEEANAEIEHIYTHTQQMFSLDSFVLLFGSRRKWDISNEGSALWQPDTAQMIWATNRQGQCLPRCGSIYATKHRKCQTPGWDAVVHLPYTKPAREQKVPDRNT